MKLSKLIPLLFCTACTPWFAGAQTVESFTFTTNNLVPDGSFSGLSDARTVNSRVTSISALTVRLKLTGEFNGDMYAYLRHTNGFVVLLNRVGRTASNPFGYADSGFNVTFQTGAANGDIHVYQNVTNPAAGAPLFGTWEPDGRNVDPTNVTDLSSRTTSLTNFNGLAGSGAWTLYLADTETGGTNMLTQWGLDISGIAAPAVVWTNPANITYGAALGATQLNATAVYNSTNVPGTLTYSTPAGTILNAGNSQVLSVTFTPANTNNFAAVTTNVVLNVLPASLIVTANNTNSIYGSAAPAFTASYSGFVNGDTAASLTTAPTLATTATSSSDVGNYPVIPSSAVGANYNISYVNGSLTINPVLITVMANNQSKTYGAALPTLTAAYTGFVLGQNTNVLTALATLATTATAGSSAGTYPITASGATATDYTFNYVAGTLTIAQALSSGVVSSSLNPVPASTNVTLMMTVSAVAPGAGTPGGTVNFRIDGSIAGSGTLAGGMATFSTTSLAVGSHVVTAEYPGDQNFAGVTNSLAQSLVINPLPVAGNVTIYRSPLSSLKIRVASLLTNASDAAGFGLTLSVSPTSASNATVTIGGGWVFYLPPAGLTNTDSFTYTVSDGHGGTATGTVTVAIQSDAGLSANLNIAVLGNGTCQISGNGIPGYSYHLQYSDTLMPFNWQSLTNAPVTAGPTGAFEYTDTTAGQSQTRYYRTVYP